MLLTVIIFTVSCFKLLLSCYTGISSEDATSIGTDQQEDKTSWLISGARLNRSNSFVLQALI